MEKLVEKYKREFAKTVSSKVNTNYFIKLIENAVYNSEPYAICNFEGSAINVKKWLESEGFTVEVKVISKFFAYSEIKISGWISIDIPEIDEY